MGFWRSTSPDAGTHPLPVERCSKGKLQLYNFKVMPQQTSGNGCSYF